MKISSVINYCTYDQRFITPCIDAIRSVSDEVIVTYTSCFYDGSPENYDLIHSTISSHPDVRFIEIPYETNKRSELDWCSYSRVIGRNAISDDSQYLLFVDSDEVLIVDAFLSFFNSSKFEIGTDYKFLSYWYFRDVLYQSKQYEESITMMYVPSINMNALSHDRTSLFSSGTNKKQNYTTTPSGLPLVHHFSWARNKEGMLKKVSTWGHKNDRDWTSLIETEFTHEFNGTDFVHGYSYNILTESPI
jgi:hypothetical protein